MSRKDAKAQRRMDRVEIRFSSDDRPGRRNFAMTSEL